MNSDDEPAKQITPATDSIVILPTDPEYLSELESVQFRAYEVDELYRNHPEMLNAEKFANHLRVFPEGQFMAMDTHTGDIVGTCTSMMIPFEETQPLLKSWRQTTANGTLQTHDPRGDWLYGVDCVVLPEYRGKGVGGRLIKARYNVARRLNLRGMIAGSMIIDYHTAAAEGVSVGAYVDDVVAGRRWDTNLSKQLKKGFRVQNIIPNYLEDSAETLNYAVAIRWDNPDYRERKRPARPAVASRRPAPPRPSLGDSAR